MKHIEQIQPEYAAEELERIVREEGDATASAALSRLLHDWTGCVIHPTADTPESEVEELVPLCLSILRRHWTTPLTALGDGTTPMSLADLMRRLIGDRVDGNEALGILPANADIPTAVAALRDRKIGGVPEAPDGISLVNLMCSAVSYEITELIDKNNGWTMSKQMLYTTFPNVEHIDLFATSSKGFPTLFEKFANLKTANLPYFKEMRYDTTVHNDNCGILIYCPLVESINMPNLERMYSGSTVGYYAGYIAHSCPELLEIVLPKIIQYANNNAAGGIVYNCAKLRKLVTPLLDPSGSGIGVTNGIAFQDCPHLIHLELGEAINNINYRHWIPTMALRTDIDAEDYVDLREDMSMANNLEQFLYNFKTYIAQRLKGGYAVGTGPTLTLSQAVRDAIQTDPDIVNIITSKGWTISPAPSV